VTPRTGFVSTTPLLLLLSPLPSPRRPRRCTHQLVFLCHVGAHVGPFDVQLPHVQGPRCVGAAQDHLTPLGPLDGLGPRGRHLQGIGHILHCRGKTTFHSVSAPGSQAVRDSHTLTETLAEREGEKKAHNVFIFSEKVYACVRACTHTHTHTHSMLVLDQRAR